MSDYDYLPASDGSGDASLMHVMSNRIVGATTIVVDTVVGVPAKFIGTSGTLLASGFLDPATITNFKGHVSGGNLIIDAFESGSTDVGNTSGQVVIVKPNTGWANRVASFIKNATGFGTPENLYANNLTVDGNETVDGTSDVLGRLTAHAGITIPTGQTLQVPSGATVDMQHVFPSDITKTSYTSASFTTYLAQSYTPALTGRMAFWYTANFGFQTSAVAAFFRAQIGGVTVTNTIEHINADTSSSSSFMLLGFEASVTAGTPITINFQVQSDGSTFLFYILNQALLLQTTP